MTRKLKYCKVGFKHVANYLESKRSRLKYARSCTSCHYFYSDNEDSNDYCHNSNVTMFDYVDTGNNTSCFLWIPIWVDIDKVT